MRVTKPIDPDVLSTELTAASVAHNGLGLSGEAPGAPGVQELFTYDATGGPIELPPEAVPVVDAHDAKKPAKTKTFEAAEDAERLRLINERAREDPAFAALADLVVKEQP